MVGEESMNKIELLKILVEENPEAIILNGFDEAMLGIARRCSSETVLVYDRNKIIDILSEDMSAEEADEYISFNIEGAWMGDSTPYIMENINV